MADNSNVVAPRRRGLLFGAIGVVVLVLVVVLLLVRAAGSGAPTPQSSVTSAPSSAGSTGDPTGATPSETATVSSPSPAGSTTRPTPTASTAAPTTQPDGQATTSSPVPIRKKAVIRPELSARVSKLEAVKGTAQGPGEVAGPAIRARISLTNSSAKKLDLANTVVNLYYGSDDRPGSALSGPGVTMLPTAVKAGQTVSGVFVFGVPEDARDTILITVDYSVKTPVVAFRGAGPR